MKYLLAALAAFALVLPACSDDGDGNAADEGADSSGESAESTTTAQAEEPLVVLVTNDDGVDAEGVDTVVEALRDRDDLELVVVAPAENQSGSGGRTTGGALTATDATTASGYEATAVAGFPADSVIWALGEGGIEADLVVSGINEGQNIGPLVPLSGTIGAARQAAQLGVPAVAVSQGFGEPPEFDTAADALVAWLEDNLDAVRDGSLGTDSVASINAPTCDGTEVQGQVEVPVAESTDIDLNAVDCEGTVEPTDDVVAFTNGWVTLSTLAPTGSNTE